MDDHPILVGYDGTAGSGAALRWALNEAVRRGVGVRLVRVLDQARAGGSPEGTRDRAEAEMMDEANVALDKIGSPVAGRPPAVDITCVALSGPVVETLCEQSCRASVAVLGNRGMGGLAGLLLGSVSVAVAAHAHCPVAVVREDMAPVPGGPVVVGVDGSEEARLAVEFAFAEAFTRGVGLEALYAVPPLRPALRHEGDAPVEDAAAARAVLEAALSECRTRYPRVRVGTQVLPGAPGQVLAGASRDAQLLAVGSRGRGGFHGLVLGSVSQQVLHRARCPVTVVRRYSAPAVTEEPAGTAASTAGYARVVHLAGRTGRSWSSGPSGKRPERRGEKRDSTR